MSTDIALTADARARAERIRVGIHSFIATRKEIADAYRDRDWSTLGYESWEQYVDGEFSETRVRLTADERREAVAELRFAGMSQRAIGAALGVSKDTVGRDLAGVSSETPDEITGADGKSYASTKPRPAAVPPEVREAVEDVTPDLKPRIVRQLTHAGPEGLTVADIAAAWPGVVSHDDLRSALGELEESGQVEPAGRALRGNHMEDVWALAELPDVTPEDHPETGEGRSAGLTSAAGPADASAGSVVDPDAADELPARACEACGGPVDQDAIAAGFLRCEACDEDGDHVDRDGVCMGCNPSADEDEPESAAPSLTPEQRKQIEADGERVRAINHARRVAERFLTEVSGFVTDIEAGVLYGETGLFTEDMAAELRKQADRVERYLEGRQ